MSNSNEKITLFSNVQMWYHKHIIHFMMIFILTGLPLISHTFSWVAYIIGVPISVFYSNGDPLYVGIQVCRIIHRLTAVLWIVTSIPFVLTMLFTKWELALRKRKGESWGTYVKEELQDMKTMYIDFSYPKRAGKYNLGQIAAGLAVIVFGIVMIVTGLILWFRVDFSSTTVSIMRLFHSIGFLVFVLFLIIHIYLAIHPVNKAGYNAMFRDGKDDLAHAKKKHPGMFTK